MYSPAESDSHVKQSRIRWGGTAPVDRTIFDTYCRGKSLLAAISIIGAPVIVAPSGKITKRSELIWR